MTEEEAKELNEHLIEQGLKEACEYYGGWDKVREIIQMLERNDKEAAIERYLSNY